MKTVRIIVKNFFSLSSAQILSQAISFLVIVFIARTLGVADFGKISFAQAVTIYFMLFTDLGLTVLGVREVAKNKAEIDDYVGNIVALRLSLASLSFVGLLVFVGLIDKPIDIKYLIILYGLSLFPSALLIEWLFQGVEKMEFIALARIIDKVLYGALVFLLVKGSGQLLMIPYLWLVASLFAAVFLLFVFVRRIGKIRLRFSLLFWKRLLKGALPIGGAFIMMQIYHNFAIIMLGFTRGDEVVGWYNAAYKVVLFFWVFIRIFVNVIFPLMSRYHKESLEKLRVLIMSSTRMLTVIALPLGVGGTILAKPIMGFFYGGEFANSVVAFQILIWSVVVICMRCTYEQSFLACGGERRYLLGVIAGASTNIGLNLFLVPYFGLKGAAIAVVISECVFALYMFSYFKIVSRVKMMKYALKPLLAATAMGFVMYYINNFGFLLAILTGVATYSISILLLKGVTLGELVKLGGKLIEKGEEKSA